MAKQQKRAGSIIMHMHQRGGLPGGRGTAAGGHDKAGEPPHLKAGNAGLVDHAGGAAHAGNRALPCREAMLLDDVFGDPPKAVRPLLPILDL